jgi:hypothetical protein
VKPPSLDGWPALSVAAAAERPMPFIAIIRLPVFWRIPETAELNGGTEIAFSGYLV